MKKLFLAAVLSATCGSVSANLGEMFWFPEKSGAMQEFSDDSGNYESALSVECDSQKLKTYDDCLGIIFNGDSWVIDAARDDSNILVGNEPVMITVNGVVQRLHYIRVDTAIVINRSENPGFQPIGKVLEVVTAKGKGEFTL